MARYKLVISKRALKDCAKIPAHIMKNIDRSILNLSDTPFPPQSLKLAGSEYSYRLRIGDYRVLYSVEPGLIQVFTIGHRKDVYRNSQ